MSTPIRPRERDAIVAALTADPNAIEAIAQQYHRTPGTIDKIRAKAMIGKGRQAI